ncbi:hypothetical protein YW7DRAFT_00081 [Streptomyces sp. AmelKG-E11A]|nr:hypothetical protein YW7DRAFT_00081 [Streptomyces sp. AmelKG-E11A]
MIGASRDRCPATPAATCADGPVRTTVPGGPGPQPAAIAFSAGDVGRPVRWVQVAQRYQRFEQCEQYEQFEQFEQFQHRKRGVPP